MKRSPSLIRIAILLLSVLSFLGAANVGDVIRNSADISYTISSTDYNQTTNEVNNTIVATPAAIEFLMFDPNGNSEMLQPTSYIDSSGSSQTIPPAQLPDGTTVTPPAAVTMTDTGLYTDKDLIIIRVTDIDRNTDMHTQQTIDVNVTDPTTGDLEVLTLTETGSNTGVFVGYLHSVPANADRGDGDLGVGAGDRVSAIYMDNGTLREVKAEAVIVASQFRLRTVKEQSKETASIGEFVKYTITVENISNIALTNVLIEDKLSHGLKYQDGSFRVNGVPAVGTLSADGRVLSYIEPNLAAGAKVQISYVALIGAGIINGEAVNLAWASSRYGGRSNTAKTVLEIKEELSRSKGYILGMVRDANISCKAEKSSPKGKDAVIASSPVASVDGREQKIEGCGIEGIKIYMEDGRFVVTDKDGRYHFLDVSNGTHVVQMDDESFKGRYKLASCEQSTRFAGASRSQFVDIYHGEMARADFCLERLLGITGDAKLTISIAKKSNNEVTVTLKIDKNMGLIDPEVFLALSEGLEYIKNSTSNHIEPEISEDMIAVKLGSSTEVLLRLKTIPGTNPDKEVRGILYYDTQLEQNQRSEIAQVAFATDSGMKGRVTHIVQPTDSVAVSSVGGKTPIAEGDYNWTKPTKQVYMPEYTPEEVDALGTAPAIVWPPKGWIPDIPSTRVAILYPKGHTVELRLNDRKVSMLNYEGIFRDSKKQMSIMHYKGVDLAEGRNIFTALIKKGDKVVKRVSREVFVESRSPKQIEFIPEYSYLVADGKHSPIIAVRFIGPSGNVLRGGMVGSFTTDSEHEPAVMSNGKGQYTIDSEGIAYIRLKPTATAGEAVLNFKLQDDKSETIKVYLKPHMREWILVGFAEGTVGYRKLSGNMESLADKDIKEGWYSDGRVAFFAKGRIKGDWLLTMAYDSGREDGDRELFDVIDKDAYYTLFNDATSQGNEAPSTKKLYLKLEKGAFSLLFGDYHTKLESVDLANYSRSFTGLKADYRGSNVRATAFVAETDELFFREEHRGDGTRGYYQLGQKPIIEGSETITIETRDRHREEIILERRELQRYRDYDIDYDKGTLYFREPIYSTDNRFNPQYIVAKYEVEGDGQSHYTYGGRVSAQSSDGKYQAGATYVNEETGTGSNTLYGVDARVKLSDNLELKAEYAHTSNGADDNKTKGDAFSASIEYQDDNLSARAYYREQDGSFGLGQLSEDLSATRKIGLDISKKLDENWTLSATIYQNRDYDANDTATDEYVGEIIARYTQEKWSADLGYRYAKGTDTEAVHQITGKLERKFYDGNLTAWISHDQSLGANEDREFPTRTAVGMDWKYDINTTLFAQLERSDGRDGVQWHSKVGATYTPWKDSEIKYTRLYDAGRDGNSIYDTMGLTRTLLFKEKWKVKLGYEKGIESGDEQSGKDFDAYNISINYAGEKYSSDISLDYRDADGEDKINFDVGLYIKQNESIGLAVAGGYHRSWDSDSETRDMDLKFAFVYRPLQSDWMALSRLDLTDSYTKTDTDETQTRKLISNTHLHWKPDDRWRLSLHYGLKHVIDTIDNKDYSSWTDLIGFTATYDFNKKWAAGVQGSILHSYTAKNYDYSYGASVETTVSDNTNLKFGFNLEGFDDDEFNGQNYYHQGAYLQLKIKFDQDSIKGMAKGAVR